jgi:hypothetical protein
VNARGQASVELAVTAVALILAGLAVFQVLVAGRMSAIADGAAEAAAIAVVNGRDPQVAAQDAAPGWARDRVRVRERGGDLTVTLAAPAVLRLVPGPVRVTAEAAVRRPADAER